MTRAWLKKWHFWVGVCSLLIYLIASYNNSNVQPSSPPAQPGTATVPQDGTNSYAVTDVVDGDTIKVNIGGSIETIRIIGINTPETVDPRRPVECFGKEASAKAKLLLSGTMVTLESDSTQGDTDKYGRSLRYVFLADGTDYGKLMIENGYAYEYTYNTPYKYQTTYKKAQRTAEANKVGLWAPDACSTTNSAAAPATFQ